MSDNNFAAKTNESNANTLSKEIDRGDEQGPVTKPFVLGNLLIDRVEEFYGPVFPPDKYLINLPNDAVEKTLHWQVPNFYDKEKGMVIMAEHSWVVRTPHYNVLIDPTWGNDKTRPGFGDHLNLPWIERLAETGLTPEDIDIVICTHLHSDHVGWNTKLVDGRWVPTFPNARYLFPRKEYEYWSSTEKQDFGHDLAFKDSVQPIVEAGLSELIDVGYTIDGCLIVEDAPGHTVGQVMVKAVSRGEIGIFCADVLHLPLQVAYPDCNSIACELPDLAIKTRHRLLKECAEQERLLITGHFPSPYCGRVKRDNYGGYLFIPGK